MTNIATNIGQVKLGQAKFIWDIKNFKKDFSEHKCITSPLFRFILDGIQTEWKLMLTLQYKCKKGDEDSVRFTLISCNKNKVTATVKIVLLNHKSEEEMFIIENIGFNESHSPFHSLPVCLSKTKLLDSEKGYLTNDDILTIVCIITGTNKYFDDEKQKTIEHLYNQHKLRVLHGYSNMINDKEFSDVTFVVDGKEIYAHKNILSHRSFVFRSMVTHNLSENNSNRIEIRDLDYKTVLNIIQYFYSAYVPSINKLSPTHLKKSEEEIKNLLIAAKKYSLMNLQAECEKTLANVLDTDNVFEYLNFADSYKAPLLKQKSLEYIVSRGEEIINSPSFHQYGNLHPEISCDVFRAFVKKRKLE